MYIKTMNQSAHVDLSKGAALTELILQASGTPVTVISKDPDYLFASSFLFPFPNRLANGTYHFLGSEFTFPLNDFGRPNALHGFVHDKPFVVEAENENQLVTSFRYDGSLDYFPFPFTFIVSYTLEPGAFMIDIEIINEAETAMPFGLGWHPYFHVNGSLASTELKLPEVKQYELNDNFIPTGHHSPYPRFSDFNTLEDVSLDDSFSIPGSGNSSFIKLENGTCIEIWQDSQFEFLQVYTPGDGKSIAIEPMTCGVDAWNQAGVIPTLEKGKKFNGSFGVKVH